MRRLRQAFELRRWHRVLRRGGWRRTGRGDGQETWTQRTRDGGSIRVDQAVITRLAKGDDALLEAEISDFGGVRLAYSLTDLKRFA